MFGNLLAAIKTPRYRVSDHAPSTMADLVRTWSESREIVVWSGESDHTIWGNPSDNWKFRAWHDSCHLATGLGFTPQEEMTLGVVQAAMVEGDIFARLVDIEIRGQAAFYLKTGQFVNDQVSFTLANLNHIGE